MKTHEFKRVTVISTDENKYLILKNVENSEELIGKPKRIVFDRDGIIPEFEEREVEE
jgi:hypothetical protein